MKTQTTNNDNNQFKEIRLSSFLEARINKVEKDIKNKKNIKVFKTIEEFMKDIKSK